tara:strand:+ start:85697 stop:86257 length:561 start_codon:yes stop_codon:yes gene_type:complete
MIKLCVIFTFLLSRILFAENANPDNYRNSKENRLKRQETYLAIKKQVAENIELVKDRLKKIEGVLNFELKKEKPKITTMCIPLLLVKPENEKISVYEERAELEKEIERLENVEYQARRTLANANVSFITQGVKPSDFGSQELKAKARAESLNFPKIPDKFSYKSFCDDFLEKQRTSKDSKAQQPPK